MTPEDPGYIPCVNISEATTVPVTLRDVENLQVGDRLLCVAAPFPRMEGFVVEAFPVKVVDIQLHTGDDGTRGRRVLQLSLACVDRPQSRFYPEFDLNQPEARHNIRLLSWFRRWRQMPDTPSDPDPTLDQTDPL